MRGTWWWGTLTTVWTLALVCATRVWCSGVMPIWASTLIYLMMGWGALFCYFELARTYSHRTLSPLPLGGMFYSVGAVLNLARWPVFLPGVFAAHELFHLFVIAGSACHVFFMIKVVVPARDESTWPKLLRSEANPIDSLRRRRSKGKRRQFHFATQRPAINRTAISYRTRPSDDVTLN